MFKKFIKDSIIYFIPLLISRGISILLLPIYSRVISPSQFGSLDLFYAFSNIVNLVITLEISQAVARFYIEAKSKMQKQLYASTSFWFTLIIYSIFSIIMISNSQIMSQFVMGESGLELEFNFGIL